MDWRACLICPICPLRSGERPQCDVGWAALYLRGLGSKIGRSLGYSIGPSRRGRRCRILWRVFAPLARGLVRSTVRPKTASPVFAASIASFSGDTLAWNFETDDFEAPANISPVVVFRVTAIAQAIANCRFGWVFAGHDGSGYLASIEMYARLKALLERMTRPERAARFLVCYPLRVALRSPQRGG